jgi:hypothetical protein
MPRGDRTGPRGVGAMTGRAAGYCAGFGISGYADDAGRGYGWRHWFYATCLPRTMRFGGFGAAQRKPDPKLETQALKNQAKALQSELDLIKKRLDELEVGAAGQ